MIRYHMAQTESLEDRIKALPHYRIAARLREARADRGYSHDQLGARAGGVSRQHLIKLEQAQHKPKAAMLERLAEALDLPVDWFLADHAGAIPPRAEENAA